jgi:hypothetical protein
VALAVEAKPMSGLLGAAAVRLVGAEGVGGGNGQESIAVCLPKTFYPRIAVTERQ